MPIHPQVEWQATLMNLDGIQTLVVSRLTVAEPVNEILFFLAAIRAGGILSMIKPVEVLLERRVVTGS